MTIPNKRKLTWVSEDIEDEDVIQERKERRKLAHDLHFDYRIRHEDKLSRDRQYSELRGRGLSVARATLAAYDAMPVTKKGKKIQGIGAKYKAKKKAANYGATPAFNRALVAAVKKVESKTLETYYSNFGINWYTGSPQASGTAAPGGFGSASGAAANTTANNAMNSSVHVMALPVQIQTGTTAGYRKGQFITPLGFRWFFRGKLANYNSDHEFNMVLCRYKGNSPPTTSNYSIQFAGVGNLNLFETGAFGPNASGFSTTNDSQWQSASRFNRDVWDVKKHIRFKVAYQKDPYAQYAATTTFRHDGYYKFPDKTWDYTSNTGTSIKGGDYYIIMWQEGDETNSSTASATIAQHSMQLNMELSFKDA